MSGAQGTLQPIRWLQYLRWSDRVCGGTQEGKRSKVKLMRCIHHAGCITAVCKEGWDLCPLQHWKDANDCVFVCAPLASCMHHLLGCSEGHSREGIAIYNAGCSWEEIFSQGRPEVDANRDWSRSRIKACLVCIITTLWQFRWCGQAYIASQRFAENSKWITWSSNSDLQVRYSPIISPIFVLRSACKKRGKSCYSDSFLFKSSETLILTRESHQLSCLSIFDQSLYKFLALRGFPGSIAAF